MKEEDKQQRETVNTRAQEILNEQMDEVKDMNKMLQYTKCVTIRDKQLNQNKYIYIYILLYYIILIILYYYYKDKSEMQLFMKRREKT